MTPGRYVESVRVEVARRLLEESGESGEHIARASGFGTPETMRHVFSASCAPDQRSTAAASAPTRLDSPNQGAPMDIAIVAFDNMAALDAIGPFEVLAHLPDTTVTWVGTEVGMKRTEEGENGGGHQRRHRDRRPPAPRHHRCARRTRGAGAARRRPLHLMAPERARDVAMDDVGVHRFPAARSRRPSAGQAGDQPLAGTRRARAVRCGADGRTCRDRRQDRHRSRCVGRHRHGAHARRQDRGRRGGSNHSARHRVRPTAAVRRRIASQGPRVLGRLPAATAAVSSSPANAE